MLIGVPKEVKNHEYRVGLVPGSVRELVHHGHKVVVESSAGVGIGFDDSAYENAGAEILTRAADVFADRKSTRLNSSHITISYAGFCLKKKKKMPSSHPSQHTTHANTLPLSPPPPPLSPPSLHDALPICRSRPRERARAGPPRSQSGRRKQCRRGHRLRRFGL